MRFRAGGAERDYTSMSRAIHLVRCGPSFRWKRGVRSHGRRHFARSMPFARRGEGTHVCLIGPGLHGLALRLRRRTSQEPRTGPGYFTLSTQYSMICSPACALNSFSRVPRACGLISGPSRLAATMKCPVVCQRGPRAARRVILPGNLPKRIRWPTWRCSIVFQPSQLKKPLACVILAPRRVER